MLTLYDIKPAFQNLLRPCVLRLAKAGITANQVTLFTAGLSLLFGALLCHAVLNQHWARFYWLPIWMFLRMALNAIDGMLARECGQKTKLGAYLNELTDVISDAALYLPFALVPQYGLWAVVAFIWLSALSEMTGVLALMVGQPRCYAGPLGKSDRAFVMGALGLWLAYMGMPEHTGWAYLFPTLCLLLCVNIINRIRRGLISQ